MKQKIIQRVLAILLTGMLLLAVTACTSTTSGTATDSITEGETAVTTETLDSSMPAPPPGGGGGEINHGDYANLVTEDAAGVEYTSTSSDENAVRVEGDSVVTLSDIVITKSGDAGESGDDSNFYGLNAGLLAMDSAEVTLENAVVTTTSEGSNGIFSYGDSTVYVNGTDITTTANSSGGVMVAGGGTMYVTDSSVETDGDHSAALRTDRGGGILTVDGGEYISHGEGSPAVYSTAEITVSNATLTATGSEALVIEGKNSIILEDCDVEGTMSGQSDENVQNVMIYQSMSGDADEGMSIFTMTGGSLVSNSGDMIYVTNTACTIELTDVDLSLSNEVLLKAVGNESARGWGTAGANGGDVTFTAASQELSGEIIVDEISTLELALEDGTTYTGAINADGQAGSVAVSIDGSSTWVLTGDSYITSLDGAGSVDENGFTLYVNGASL